MKYMSISKASLCNGLGVRVVLWVSGCTHQCSGCHNECSWNFNNGKEFGYGEMSDILELLAKPYIKGITFSGGDPLHNRNLGVVTEIAKVCKEKFPNKDIWCYTGFKWEDVKDFEIINYIDVLVDGKFELDKRDITLAFKGSSNQRIINVKESVKENKIVTLDIA